jgi:hypothetical protein
MSLGRRPGQFLAVARAMAVKNPRPDRECVGAYAIFGIRGKMGANFPLAYAALGCLEASPNDFSVASLFMQEIRRRHGRRGHASCWLFAAI